MGNVLTIEPGIETALGHCDTCGHESRVFRGLVYERGEAYGTYVCYYTDAHPELGVSMAVSLRGWGSGADPLLKECVALEWRQTETGPGCMVVDGSATSWAKELILGRILSRAAALASGRATEAFAVSDTVWLHDSRLQHAVHGS